MTVFRRPLRGLLLALAGLVAVTATLASSGSPASAAGAPHDVVTTQAASHGAAPGTGERARYYWGVIAVSSDAAVGAAYNYRSKRAAKHRALIGCKEHSNVPKTCTASAIFANQCAAIAVTQRPSDGYITGFAAGFDRFRQHAKREALRKLHRKTPGGHILYSLCSG